MSDRIYFFDTTLRDGEQSPGATMNLQEKLRVARQLEMLGVDVIEAGFPVSSQGDFEAVQAIAKEIRTTQVAALGRAVISDVDRTWEAIKGAAAPRLHTFLSTSPLHMRYKLGKDPETVLEMAVSSVKRAARYTSDVQFCAEDASRSDKDFLCRVLEGVIKAGAKTVDIADTVGYAQPEEFAGLIRYLMEHVPNSDKALFSVHCHNDLGFAVANTLAAFQAGARQADVTLLGIGERAGNASLEEIAMALRVRSDFFKMETNIRTEQLYPACRQLSLIIGHPIPVNKAIVGDNVFAHEAGIHQDGMLKNRETYEIMTPQSVGRGESDLVLGKHSGRNAVKNRLVALGYALDDAQINIVFEAVKALADKKKSVLDEDLTTLVLDEIYHIPDPYRLRRVSVKTSSSGDERPSATVVIDVNGEERTGTGYGTGPVNAAFNVIADLVGHKPELQQYSVRGLSLGTDAQSEATVRICENGCCAAGASAHPDVTIASARAYVHALNRMVKQENKGTIIPDCRCAC